MAAEDDFVLAMDLRESLIEFLWWINETDEPVPSYLRRQAESFRVSLLNLPSRNPKTMILP